MCHLSNWHRGFSTDPFPAIILTYTKEILQMKYEVIFVAGSQRLSEQVHANSPREAQQVVMARNPNARIVNVTVPRSSSWF